MKIFAKNYPKLHPIFPNFSKIFKVLFLINKTFFKEVQLPKKNASETERRAFNMQKDPNSKILPCFNLVFQTLYFKS